MTLLGKILALVNILAAVGFIYLAASDYGKRQQWSHAVSRHDRIIDGLPLDDQEKDVDGRPIVKDLTDAIIQEHFQQNQAGGGPVKTQLAEVQRVQGVVRDRINGADLNVPDPLNPQAQLTLATPAQRRAWFLLPLARSLTAPEPQPNEPAVLGRQNLIAQMRGAGEKYDEAALNKVFEDALGKTDPGDKRQAIADLLFSLTDVLAAAEGQAADSPLADSPVYKRFVVVVGLKAAAQAVDNQAAALARMAQEAEDVLVANRSAFAAVHGRLVSRIQDLSDQLQRAQAALDVQRNQVDRQDQVVKEREVQVKNLEARLAAARKATTEELAKQNKVQEAVLEAQRKLRDANQTNQELLRKILSLEEQAK
jgi:hypothetical protein